MGQKDIAQKNYLSPEQVKLFKSDFGIIADYFVQTRANKDYVPSEETITHVSEFLQLMRVLTGDDRFTPDTNLTESKGKSVTMCEVLDKAENRGRIKTLYELVKDGILTLQQAAERMEMTESKFKASVKKLATD